MLGAVPLSTKLTAAQTDDATSSLPAVAQSTRVLQELQRYPGDLAVPTVAVYVRDSGLTAGDLAAVDAARERVTAAAAEGSAPAVATSPSGRAASLTVQVPGGDQSALVEQVSGISAAVRQDLPDGLRVALTGPGGQARDFARIGEGIDTRLLVITAVVVAIILLVTYRSPVLLWAPLLAVGAAITLAQAATYLLADAGLAVDAQSASILTVLVFGVGTDYALLLIARYREELRRVDDRYAAMARAVRHAAPAVLASGATVVLGLLCLLAGDLTSNRSLGPVGAVGVLCALAAMMSLLPALLVVCGPWLFWPLTPRAGDTGSRPVGIWSKVAGIVDSSPRRIWVGTAAALVVLSLGALSADLDMPAGQTFTGRPESVVGQEELTRQFPATTVAPAVILTDTASAPAVLEAARSAVGVREVTEQRTVGERTQLTALLDAPDVASATPAVQALRERVAAVTGSGAVVGGEAAQVLDTHRATAHDRRVVVPLVLLVILAVLALLLRAVVAPLLLLATVVLSYAAALGATALIATRALGHTGLDPAVPLLGFIFLVALGVDYTIFLMTRAREEVHLHGTRDGMLRALTMTGGVITSAGIVLAAVFAALGVLPLVLFVQLAVLVGLGVLLDTLVVRTLLVPALTLELDRRVWWPSALSAPAQGPL